MGAGLTSAMSTNQELQCYSHCPFMNWGSWWTNISFPFFKANKNHTLPQAWSQTLSTGSCLAQLQLSIAWTARQAQGQLSWRAKEGKVQKIYKEAKKENKAKKSPPSPLGLTAHLVTGTSSGPGAITGAGGTLTPLQKVLEWSSAWKCALPYHLSTDTSFRKIRCFFNTH